MKEPQRTEFGPRGKEGIRGGGVTGTRHRPGAQLRHCCVRSAGVRSTLPVPCHGLEGFRLSNYRAAVATAAVAAAAVSAANPAGRGEAKFWWRGAPVGGQRRAVMRFTGCRPVLPRHTFIPPRARARRQTGRARPQRRPAGAQHSTGTR